MKPANLLPRAHRVDRQAARGGEPLVAALDTLDDVVANTATFLNQDRGWEQAWYAADRLRKSVALRSMESPNHWVPRGLPKSCQDRARVSYSSPHPGGGERHAQRIPAEEPHGAQVMARYRWFRDEYESLTRSWQDLGSPRGAQWFEPGVFQRVRGSGSRTRRETSGSGP